jgi:hypothetical protein
MELNDWLALVGYITIVIVALFPLLLHISNSILISNIPSISPKTNPSATVGLESRDTYHFLWNFWWVKTAFISGQNVFFTRFFFYPQGSSLALQTIDFADALIAAPISFVAGSIVAYNSIIVLSFIFGGFTAFLLAKYLTRSWIASFGAGLIFVFAPQHLSQAEAGHPNLSSIEWMPILMLSLLVAYDRGQIRYAIVSGIMLAIMTYTDPQLLVIGLIMFLMYLCYILARNHFKRFKKFVFLTVTIIVAWLGLSSPYLIPAYMSLGVVHAAPSYSNALVNSAKPALFLIPPPGSILYGELFSSVYTPQRLVGGYAQWIIFVGYVTLTLAAIGVVASKDRRRFIFLGLAIVAFLFSLGPSPTPSQISIQTPYTFLYDHVSILRYFRAEARFSILLMFALSILAAYGINACTQLVQKNDGVVRGKEGKIMGIILLALILLEFAPIITITPVTSDPIYNKLAQDNSQFAVLELPTTISIAQKALYEQTIYEKPLVNGKISQSSISLPAYMGYEVFLCQIIQPPCRPSHEIIEQSFSYRVLGPIVMTYFHIKYIIVHTKQMSPRALARVTLLLKQSLGAPFYRDSDIIAWELSHWVSNSTIIQDTQNAPLSFLGFGWLRGIKGVTGLVANNSAQIIVYAGTPDVYSISMHSSVFPTCIANTVSNQPIQCGAYDPNTGISTYYVWLNAGKNVLNLQIGAISTTVTSFRISMSSS